LNNIDEQYMQRAIELASKAKGKTSPNPLVGAVIVKDGKIIGEGYHQKAGTPHAEIHALHMAEDNAAGATLYVTLEPCCHYGKTPPCTEAIINARIKNVVMAVLDPNPKVAGGGLKILQEAGIHTEVGVLEEEAVRMNEVFLKYMKTGMPFTAVKTAMTLDGKIAAYSGDSRWITGEDSRKYVHQLRNTYDAILVGIGTVLADDPQLNTRLEIEDSRNPVRIIIDGNLELPIDSKIARSSKIQPTIVFTGMKVDQEKVEALGSLGLEIIRLATRDGIIPLVNVMRELADREIISVLVEGGSEINASLIKDGLLDKAYWFIAPKIIGGRKAPSPVGGEGCELMKDAWGLKIDEVMMFENDLLITGYF